MDTEQMTVCEHIAGAPFAGYSRPAQLAGARAYRMGHTLSACPYQSGSHVVAGQRSSWRYGWLQEQAMHEHDRAREPLNPAKGLVHGLLIASAFWTCVFLFIYALMWVH